MIVLQPPLLCEGWDDRPISLSGDSSILMDLRWTVIVKLRQYSVHWLSISRSVKLVFFVCVCVVVFFFGGVGVGGRFPTH